MIVNEMIRTLLSAKKLVSVRSKGIYYLASSFCPQRDIIDEDPKPIRKAKRWLASPPVIPMLAFPNLAKEIWVRPSGRAFPIERKTLPK